MKKVRLRTTQCGPHGTHYPGTELELADDQADVLLRSGQAVEVVAGPGLSEPASERAQAVAPPAAERMTQPTNPTIRVHPPHNPNRAKGRP